MAILYHTLLHASSQSRESTTSLPLVVGCGPLYKGGLDKEGHNEYGAEVVEGKLRYACLTFYLYSNTALFTSLQCIDD